MPSHTPQKAAGVRAIREAVAEATKRAREDMARTLSDPDLKPDVAQRRAADTRGWIKKELEGAIAKAKNEVKVARDIEKLFDPTAVRRRAVLTDPERAAALRGALAGLSASELSGFADEAVAARDELLAFAVAKTVELHPHAAGNEELAAVAKRLARPLTPEALLAHDDRVAAAAELALLEHADLPVALGERRDAMKLGVAMDAAGITSDLHAGRVYGSIGLPIAAPKSIASQPELVAVGPSTRAQLASALAAA